MNNDTTTLNGQTMGTAMADFLKANPNIANQSSPITPAPATAIPATALTPQGSVNVPRPTTQVTPVFNEIVQGADNTINEQVARAKAEAEAVQKSVGSEAEKARTSLTDEVKRLFGQKTEVMQGQAQTERDLGIDEQIIARNQVNTEIADTTLRLRAEEDRLRTAGMSKGQLAIEQGNLQDTFGRRLADLAIRQSAVNGNIEAIRSESERKTKLALAPIENSLEFFKTFGMENLNFLTEKDKTKLSMIVTNLENQKKDVKALEDAKANLIMEIANQGGGSNTQLISSIQGAKTQAEALAIASKSGFIGRLDRQLKQAQLSKIYSDMRSATDTSTINANINQLSQQADPVTNKQIIASILSGKAVSAGTKGRLAPANSVLSAVQDFSEQRQAGKFTGVGVAGRVKEGLKSVFNLENPESIVNKQNLEAINLKVQQWASGAALTDAQTKQVERFTPSKNDSDKVVRTKLSGLYNYMIKQIESDLLTDGVNVSFAPVNLFETYDLMKKATPEQLAELKALGLIQ